MVGIKKFLFKIFNDYLVFEKAILTCRSLTNRRRKLSKTDLLRIANRYVMLGYTLDFLDDDEWCSPTFKSPHSNESQK